MPGLSVERSSTIFGVLAGQVCWVTPIDILYERSLNSYRHSIGEWGLERNQPNLLQGTLEAI
jgi:hypothetical protein